MNNGKKISLVFAGILLTLVVSISHSSVTYAVTEALHPTTAYKGFYQGVYKCYNGGAIKKTFGSLSNYSGIDSLLTNKASSSEAATVHLVSGFKDGQYNIGTKRTMSCSDLFKGWTGGGPSFLAAVGKKAPSNNATTKTIKDFMTGMGYVVDSNKNEGDETKCYRLTYNSTNKTNRVCQSSNGKLSVEGKETQAHFRINSGKVCLYLPAAKNANKTKKWGCLAPDANQLNGEFLLKIINTYCGSMTCKAVVEGNNKTFKFASNVDDNDETRGVNYDYASLSDYDAKLQNPSSTAALNAIGYLSGGKYTTADSIRIGKVETRLLYQGYLTSYYKVKVSCKSGESPEAYDGQIRWFVLNTGEFKTCNYETSKAKNTNTSVNKVNDKGFLIGKIDGYKALINEIKKLPEDYTQDEIAAVQAEIASSPTDNEVEDIGSDGDDATCYAESGKLGWIICPVIKGASEAGTYLWDRVQEMLNVPAQEVFAGDSGVRTAWGAIRDIANVIFVVLFLMVIFSQLTGVGIDNYGIKRILPKLIVAAILINLSYVICELAVDISNILGNGLESLLSSQAADINYGSEEISTGNQAASGLVLTALAGGGAALYVLMNPLGIIALGIAVLGVVIAIVIAIIFLYLILVIRQAGVVLLVVLAPAAVVCYMLPNTEKWYKRWFELFKALLLVYPICGAMVGGGQLAGAILASIDEPAMKVAAMIVTVAPFFLIPTLLRSSLSLMGNIGARLQNVAGRARRGAAGVAGGAMRNSETLQGLDSAIGRHSFSARRRAEAVVATGALMSTWSKRNRLADRSNMATRIASIAAGEEAKAVDEATTQRLSLMQSGGITMQDGSKRAYNLDSMAARLTELRGIAADGGELNHAQRSEVSALMRGMAAEKGGGGRLGRIIRESDTNSRGERTGRVNSSFMDAIGASYANDAAVRSKMNEKDAGASAYAERFTPGGDRANDNTFDGFRGMTDERGNNIYNAAIQTRIPSYEAGLNQGGAAIEEYIDSLNANDCQKIMDDEKLMNSLNVADRNRFLAHAEGLGVTGRSAREVVVKGGDGGNVVGGSGASERAPFPTTPEIPRSAEVRDSGLIVTHDIRNNGGRR